MKTLLNSALLALSLAVVGTNVASADDSQLQVRLAAQRQTAQSGESSQPVQARQSTPTIAVYAHERGVGQRQRAPMNQEQYVWKTRQFGNGSPVTYLAPAE